MSCPNWQELAAHRDTRSGQEPEGWREALAHFDSCKACREEALAAEPTLIFRRLPEAVPEDSWDAEIASVQQAVAAMRTASRLESLQSSPRRHAFGVKEWAPAAAVVATVGGVGSWYGVRHQPIEIVAQSPRVSAAPAFAEPAAAKKVKMIEGSYANAEIQEYGGQNVDDIVVAKIFVEGLEI